jgi:hypothetical protein
MPLQRKHSYLRERSSHAPDFVLAFKSALCLKLGSCSSCRASHSSRKNFFFQCPNAWAGRSQGSLFLVIVKTQLIDRLGFDVMCESIRHRHLAAQRNITFEERSPALFGPMLSTKMEH